MHANQRSHGYCPARAKCHLCYRARVGHRQRVSREFTVLLRLLEINSDLRGHKAKDLFQTRDYDSTGAVVLSLPGRNEQVRLRDLLSCCSGGGRSGGAERQGTSHALPEADDMPRGVGSHVLADGLRIVAAQIVHDRLVGITTERAASKRWESLTRSTGCQRVCGGTRSASSAARAIGGDWRKTRHAYISWQWRPEQRKLGSYRGATHVRVARQRGEA